MILFNDQWKNGKMINDRCMGCVQMNIFGGYHGLLDGWLEKAEQVKQRSPVCWLNTLWEKERCPCSRWMRMRMPLQWGPRAGGAGDSRGCREEMKKGWHRNDQGYLYGNEVGAGPRGSQGIRSCGYGKTRGPGCYCAANTLLTNYLDRLIKNYAYIVVDNEAGMEHISRLTTNNIDLLLIVPTRAGEEFRPLPESLSSPKNSPWTSEKGVPGHQAKENQEADIKKNTKEFGLELFRNHPGRSAHQRIRSERKADHRNSHEKQAVEKAFKIFDTIL